MSEENRPCLLSVRLNDKTPWLKIGEDIFVCMDKTEKGRFYIRARKSIQIKRVTQAQFMEENR